MLQITSIIPTKLWTAEPQFGNIATFYAKPQLGDHTKLCAKLGLGVPKKTIEKTIGDRPLFNAF